MGIADRIAKQNKTDAARAAKNRGRVLPPVLCKPIVRSTKPLCAMKRYAGEYKSVEFFDPLTHVSSGRLNRPAQ